MKNLAHAAFGLYEATDGRNCEDCYAQGNSVVLCTFHARAHDLVETLVDALHDLTALYAASPDADPHFVAKGQAALAKSKGG